MILCSLFQDIPEGPEKDQYPGKYKAADEDPGGPGQSTQIGLSRGLGPVSYTHLDVYKRQACYLVVTE